MSEDTISEPFNISVEKVVEHEDGGATYSFEMNEKAAVNMAQIGLEFTVFCAAYQLDLQYVLDNLTIISEHQKKEHKNA